MSDGTVPGSAGGDGSRETGEDGTGLLGEIGRWFVYYVLVLIPVHWATSSIHGHMLVERLSDVDGFIAVVVAAILTTRSNPPAYGRIVVFSVVTGGMQWALDVTVGPTVPTRGGLYPPADVVLTWLAAFLFGYAVVFGIDRGDPPEQSSVRDPGE